MIVVEAGWTILVSDRLDKGAALPTQVARPARGKKIIKKKNNVKKEGSKNCASIEGSREPK